MKMKRVSLLTIGWFIGLTSLAHGAYGDLPGPSMGFITKTDLGTQYHLDFNFGIEQLQNGERTEELNELWRLRCGYPDILTKKLTTWCSLERIKLWVLGWSGAYNAARMYNSIDGTLKLIHSDWKHGRLDFSFHDKNDKNKIITQVRIRMEFVDHGMVDTKSIYLRSFEAFAIVRTFPNGTTVSIEKRIPQYTYTLNVPVKMWGFRSKDDKKWDDLLSSLSQQDQDAWENYQAEGLNKCDIFAERNTHTEDQIGEKIIPGWEKRKVELQKWGRGLTADELSRLKEYVLGQISACLVSSNISSEGQKKILEPIYARYYWHSEVYSYWLLGKNFGTN